MWRQHAQAMQKDPALQRNIADVLLSRCLPAVARQAHAAAPLQHQKELQTIEIWIARLVAALNCGTVREAAAAHLQQESAALAAATAAGNILHALPRDVSAAEDACLLVEAWSSSLHLAGSILQLAGLPVAAGSAGDAASTARSSERELAACAVVREAPAAQAVLLAAACTAAPAGEVHSWHTLLGKLCCNLRSNLIDAAKLGEQPASDELRIPWLEAAAAGVRLLPALLQLHPSLQQLEDPELQVAASQLMLLLINLADSAVPRALDVQQPSEPSPRPEAEDPATAASYAAALAALHTQLCRLIHWLVNGTDLHVLLSERRRIMLTWLMLLSSRSLLAWMHLLPTISRQGFRMQYAALACRLR